MKRKYYSQRNSGTNSKMSIEELRRFFGVVFDELHNEKYLCEKLDVGCCVDAEDRDMHGVFLKAFRKDLWPVRQYYGTDGKLDTYTKEDIFDLIEFIYDNVSEPLHAEGDHWHGFAGCGTHHSMYSQVSGKKKFLDDVNDFLADFEDGYELRENGEIVRCADQGLNRLLDAKKVELGKGGIPARMAEAEKLFYAARSSMTDRRNAVKELADCFEYIRDDVKRTLTSKDEADLFSIANNFGIRHHNEKQKTEYDQNIWLSWMFHFYLATLHASLRLIEKRKNDKK
jgi:hypothetical protein